MASMKVVITENILLEGKHTERGTVVTLDDSEARLLIGCNRAMEATKENMADVKARLDAEQKITE